MKAPIIMLLKQCSVCIPYSKLDEPNDSHFNTYQQLALKTQCILQHFTEGWMFERTFPITFLTPAKKEAQTVSHNYIYTSFIACYMFRLYQKVTVRQLKITKIKTV